MLFIAISCKQCKEALHTVCNSLVAISAWQRMFVVQRLVDDGKLEMLQDMYKSWPFFSVTLDMMEMVFAKADPRVAQFYEHALVDKSLWSFGDDLRK